MGNYIYLLLFFFPLSFVVVILLIRQKKRIRQLEKLLSNSNDKLEKLQVHFGQFTPQEVIEKLTETGGSYEPGMRTVTVLFADLKGFTKMCNETDPSVVVSILNGYFRCMNEVLSNHHGRITELIGDGLLALFGALKPNPWQVQDAVLAALAMRNSLKKYNEDLRSKSLPELSFGIGIHRGNVLAGIMGNYELSKFGVVGDPINVAARVESLTRIHNVDLLITDTVRESLDDRFSLKKMPALPVKGKEEPVATYWVEGLKSEVETGDITKNK